MLVIKRFRERKKIFRERKLSENFMQRGLIFCKEWSSIYRQENPTVTGGSPGSPRYIKVPPSRLRSLFVFCGEGCISFDLLRDCMMVVKEIVNRLLEEVEQDIDNEGEVDEEDEGGSEV
ncbi:hypothetical protein Tco_0893969 [Tanacetum coccineum]|uniref:Uncharacterized protein n=1 Tax=Tanacetum coccineum TaxID=301880 RepID=A0ABQ5CD73_9ASTR